MQPEVNKSSMTSQLAAGSPQVSVDAAQPTLLLVQSCAEDKITSDCYSMCAYMEHSKCAQPLCHWCSFPYLASLTTNWMCFTSVKRTDCKTPGVFYGL